MTFLIILGLGGLVLSIALLAASVRWALRQVNADDCCPDWEDCL